MGHILKLKSVNKSQICEALENNDYISDIKNNYKQRPIHSWQSRRPTGVTQSLDAKPLTAALRDSKAESREYFEYLSNKRAMLPVLQTSIKDEVKSENLNLDLYHFKRSVKSKSVAKREILPKNMNSGEQQFLQKQILNSMLVPASHHSQLTTPSNMNGL